MVRLFFGFFIFRGFIGRLGFFFLVILVMCVNAIGDGLRDALDPKIKG